MLEIEHLTVEINQQGNYINFFNDLNFTVSSGEVLGVFGENGSGKSVLISTIAGLNKSFLGKVNFSSDIGSSPKIGFLMQEIPSSINLDGMRIQFNEKLANEKPNLFRECISWIDQEKFSDKLSFGKKRLFFLAHLILTKCQYLLLDEPLLGLDDDLSGKAVEWIRQFSGIDTTIFITSCYSDRLEQILTRSAKLINGKFFQDTQKKDVPNSNGDFYEIVVASGLDETRSVWFDEMKIQVEQNQTVLSGFIEDQSALFGVLRKINDLGIPLVSVNSKQKN